MSQLSSFRYQAIDGHGAKAKGVVEASSREDAYRQLISADMQPLRITGTKARGRGKKITLKDLSHLTYQFSVLMEARIPIHDGLLSIADQEHNTRLRVVIEDIARQIEAGHTVNDALSPHRALFGDVYVETVRAAESSGNMVEILSHLASMLDRQYEMTKNVKSALMYPLCVTTVLGLAITFLLIVVVPRFAEMFASRDVPLPMPTQMLLALSDVLRSYWYLFLGAGVGIVFAVRRALHNRSWQMKLDTLAHRIPFIRALLQGLAVSRFVNIMGISLRSGLSLIEAIDMGSRASGRPLLQADAEKLRNQVNAGGRLADGIKDCPYLPSFAKRMISAGEEAGELPKMCEIVARNYDREVMHLARNVTTVIEPILVTGLAGIVLVVALAIFLPMWNMGALIG